LDDIGRACYVAALLTLLARPAIRGPTPLIAADANVAGAGKGKLLDVIGEIALGRSMNKTDVPGDNDEMKKLLFSIALAAGETVTFDNIKVKFGGSAIEKILTDGELTERILGVSQHATVKWTAVTFATMNNGQLTSDMARRAIVARLDSPFERPELRANFRYPDILAYCREHRTRLLRAALMVLRAYQAAGCPKVEMRAMGSYEQWSAVVRAPIIWSGLRDPAVSQDMLIETGDPERDALEQLLAAWHEAFGDRRVTSAEVLQSISEAATDYADIRPTDAPKRKLGAALKRARGRIVNGLRLDSEPVKGESGTRWFVQPVATPRS
jgi:hypothetical protein